MGVVVVPCPRWKLSDVSGQGPAFMTNQGGHSHLWTLGRQRQRVHPTSGRQTPRTTRQRPSQGMRSSGFAKQRKSRVGKEALSNPRSRSSNTSLAMGCVTVLTSMLCLSTAVDSSPQSVFLDRRSLVNIVAVHPPGTAAMHHRLEQLRCYCATLIWFSPILTCTGPLSRRTFARA